MYGILNIVTIPLMPQPQLESMDTGMTWQYEQFLKNYNTTWQVQHPKRIVHAS